MKIGITGGIGSGKSFVCQLLGSRGIKVYDCDAAAKRLMNSSSVLKQQLTKLIGPDTYLDGVLNKAVVASFLLSSETNAHAVDAIVHPAVAEDFKRSGCQWMECAILYESGFDRLVDIVIVVTASEEVRIRRIMERDGISGEKALEWINRQWPQDEVASRANYAIINDGEQELAPQLDSILQLISKKEKCNRQS
jgi:dephospho-CoA kinase